MMVPLPWSHQRILSVLLINLLFATSALSSVAAFAAPSSSTIEPNTKPTSISTTIMPKDKRVAPSIIYTIAGSDSGGGAGIQADLKAIHTLSSGSCHGCSAITCLTAQNSCGVSSVHAPPMEFFREQLHALKSDLYPRAIKVGMLGTEELATEVGGWLQTLKKEGQETSSKAQPPPPLVVVDPVMISTSGHKLIDDAAKSAMIQKVFPYADLVTPNKFEAEELLGRKLTSPKDVELGAQEIILTMGPKAVLIKGGHSLLEEQQHQGNESTTATTGTTASTTTTTTDDVSLGYAQDYLLLSTESSNKGKPVKDRPRLCDGSRGVWIRNARYDTEHTHGTGCTLSSSIATAWAMGQRERERVESGGGEDEKIGALSSMHLVDACCIAKAYVNAGIAQGMQLGKGPGPVVHTGFPNSYKNFPTIALSASSASTPSFIPMQSYHSSKSSPSAAAAASVPALGRILPIVDTIEWIDQLVSTPGITDIQLRFKDTSDHVTILDRIKRAQSLCNSNGVRLWINDYWKAAIEAGGCFGIHLGQEDMATCADAGGLTLIREAGLAFGISTHSYSELASALGVNPSYISLGPVFPTTSKDVKFDPQGLETVRQWRALIPPHVPLVAIGGIGNADVAKIVRGAGAECAAVIGAVTKVDDFRKAVADLNDAMS